MGFHDYDGILPDFSEEFIKRRVAEVQADITTLNKMSKSMDKNKIFEHNLVLARLETELFRLDVEKEHLFSPLPYIGQHRSWSGTIGAIEMSYTARSYASVDERLQAITRLEASIPEFLTHAQSVLSQQTSLSLDKLKMGINYAKGHISYLGDELINFSIQATDQTLIDS